MLVDPNNPFFRKLWVRILCVVLPLAWAGVEFANGAVAWGMVFAAAGAYLFAVLILRGPDR
ncbi:hypothetical protein SAMN05421538_101106 [Paracoccus isoporae]|uniref:DUF3329 domain-containing protein n=1 Tax=Paracoccus isoporae TaxID=591205 RepID=A0A1G6SX98_9RHOB|nr:hypothetical protein [Paracoccus isoporae]SDD20856.1 hypothetical protein SAMN05421538_101106 [Paracoccus isoporae]